MDYTEMTADDRYRMLKKRLLEYERRHFDTSVQRSVNEAAEEDLDGLDKLLADLEVAAGVVRDELSGMDVPDELPPRSSRELNAARRTATEQGA